jgi:hypothetical protein
VETLAYPILWVPIGTCGFGGCFGFLAMLIFWSNQIFWLTVYQTGCIKSTRNSNQTPETEMALYLDTHSGAIEVTLTGNETVSRQGTRFVEVAGWLREPTYVDADRLSTTADFSHRTIQWMRARDAA